MELATRPLSSSIAIDLTDVDHTGATLTINGTAQGERDVLAYASSLRASRRFSQVLVSSLQATEAENTMTASTMTDEITVGSGPTADFSFLPTSGEEPLTVSFTDLSASTDGIVSWLWNFGDGKTSTEQNPTHIYTNEGIYTVSLTVEEGDGDYDTETVAMKTATVMKFTLILTDKE